MRKTMIIASGLMAAASSAMAGERTISMRIDNMTCATCPIIVRTAVGRVAGVVSVEVDDVAKTAVVVFDDSRATPTQLTAASLEAGFPATVVE